MLIPAQRPDAVEPVGLRRDVVPPSAPVPVSGVPEQAQRADPRMAVQTVPPGFQGEAAAGLRPAPGLATPGAQALLAAAGPEPSALVQLSASGDAITQWLARALLRRPLEAALPWPPAQAVAPEAAESAAASAPLRVLWGLYLGLARSDVFAATHLFRQFWPEARPRPGDAGASAEQLRRWFQALAPDSEAALDGASMLLGGAMAWQGELLPGWPMSLRREDAWRTGDPPARALEKGVALRVQLEVPGRGPLRVEASQWGSDIDIRVSWPETVDWPQAGWDRLRANLAGMGLPGLRLSRQAWSGEPPQMERA